MRTLLALLTLALSAPLVSAQSAAPAASKPATPPAPAGAPAQTAPAQPPSGAAAAATAQPTGTAATAAPPAPAAATAVEPQGYTYDPQGRRDPFVSLVRRGAETGGNSPGARPAGLAGLTTTELALRGTLKGRQGFVAMVEGVDKKTYLARAGDKLLDGTVRAVTADAMVILQTVNDPLSLETEREVRKVLRQTQEAN